MIPRRVDILPLLLWLDEDTVRRCLRMSARVWARVMHGVEREPKSRMSISELETELRELEDRRAHKTMSCVTRADAPLPHDMRVIEEVKRQLQERADAEPPNPLRCRACEGEGCDACDQRGVVHWKVALDQMARRNPCFKTRRRLKFWRKLDKGWPEVHRWQLPAELARTLDVDKHDIARAARDEDNWRGIEADRSQTPRLYRVAPLEFVGRSKEKKMVERMPSFDPNDEQAFVRRLERGWPEVHQWQQRIDLANLLHVTSRHIADLAKGRVTNWRGILRRPAKGDPKHYEYRCMTPIERTEALQELVPITPTSTSERMHEWQSMASLALAANIPESTLRHQIGGYTPNWARVERQQRLGRSSLYRICPGHVPVRPIASHRVSKGPDASPPEMKPTQAIHTWQAMRALSEALNVPVGTLRNQVNGRTSNWAGIERKRTAHGSLYRIRPGHTPVRPRVSKSQTTREVPMAQATKPIRIEAQQQSEETMELLRQLEQARSENELLRQEKALVEERLNVVEQDRNNAKEILRASHQALSILGYDKEEMPLARKCQEVNDYVEELHGLCERTKEAHDKSMAEVAKLTREIEQAHTISHVSSPPSDMFVRIVELLDAGAEALELAGVHEVYKLLWQARKHMRPRALDEEAA